jgi:ketosteroid isomerase-like protein
MSEKLDIVRNYWNKEGEKDLEGLLAYFDSDATLEAPICPPQKGIESLRTFYGGVIEAYANSRVEVQRSTESEDRIAVEFTIHFEQHDGKKGMGEGCNVFTIRNGKIHYVKCYFDPSGFSA